MTQTTWVVLVPCALLLFACDDDQRPPAAYPVVIAQRADVVQFFGPVENVCIGQPVPHH